MPLHAVRRLNVLIAVPSTSSITTLIAWLSTCLLAGGISVSFSESLRALWMWWGCFGLAAAIGLEAASRIQERRRIHQADKRIRTRFERELQTATTENETNWALRQTVDRIGFLPKNSIKDPKGRRSAERHTLDLPVELLVRANDGSLSNRITSKASARLTNLSHTGFALTLAERLSPQQILLYVDSPAGDRVTLLGEIVWCDSQPDGAFAAGGRLIRVLSPEEQ